MVTLLFLLLVLELSNDRCTASHVHFTFKFKSVTNVTTCTKGMRNNPNGSNPKSPRTKSHRYLSQPRRDYRDAPPHPENPDLQIPPLRGSQRVIHPGLSRPRSKNRREVHPPPLLHQKPRQKARSRLKKMVYENRCKRCERSIRIILFTV